MNLISYSMWGTEAKYLRGAMENVKLAEELYPGWTLRFYYGEEVPVEYISELADAGCQTVVKPFYRDPWFGLYWRFCPMYDPGVDRFIVRDTDSRLSIREADAVEEWIESDYPFHIMRDNMEHDIFICGGMWGAVPGCVPDFEKNLKEWMRTIDGHKENPRGRFHGTDQEFLSKHVWPHIKNNHIAHISPYEHLKFTGRERGFRLKNPDGSKVGIRIWG